eukprot:comp12575_c0_seq1/m.7579 comp12575_c0_seq1/g.7579  ORF comp12575_c0_seq1/g.7579 comp12575_c0_seq1/m.7579 type:complete len:240 (-) comp12575_c0_seq1:469-1188(-)
MEVKQMQHTEALCERGVTSVFSSSKFSPVAAHARFAALRTELRSNHHLYEIKDIPKSERRFESPYISHHSPSSPNETVFTFHSSNSLKDDDGSDVPETPNTARSLMRGLSQRARASSLRKSFTSSLDSMFRVSSKSSLNSSSSSVPNSPANTSYPTLPQEEGLDISPSDLVGRLRSKSNTSLPEVPKRGLTIQRSKTLPSKPTEDEECKGRLARYGSVRSFSKGKLTFKTLIRKSSSEV